ncbi:MAG: hypothetical protein WCH62_04475, partial [Candidatus Omnitrophota bacterium]
MIKIKPMVSGSKMLDTIGVFIQRKYSQWFRLFCWVVLFVFISNTIGADVARAWSTAEEQQQSIILPPPGTLIPDSPSLSLPTLKAISIDPNDPFKLDFVLDTADQGQSPKFDQGQINLLIKYFLSFLTIPEKDLWVNLSPYEKDRIITPEFETTNAGRDMLVQDYILKQLASSLTYPDHKLGKAFWKKVFNRVKAEYGSSDIPVNNFNKVWVVPDKAVVYEENGSAFISESRLKVLVEEDYLSLEKNGNKLKTSASRMQKVDRLSSEITREIILPELKREVNEGKYFAPLRQMYQSLILAIWLKKKYKEHLINKVYVNQKKTSGIALEQKQIKERVYAQYLKALKKGVYNFIREDYDEKLQQSIPRKYFSGGFSFADAAMHVTFLPATGLDKMRDLIGAFKKGLYRFTVALNPLGNTKAELISLAANPAMFANPAIPQNPKQAKEQYDAAVARYKGEKWLNLRAKIAAFKEKKQKLYELKAEIDAAAAQADEDYNTLDGKINAAPAGADTSVLETALNAIQEQIQNLRLMKAAVQSDWLSRYGKTVLIVLTIMSTLSGGFMAHAGDSHKVPDSFNPQMHFQDSGYSHTQGLQPANVPPGAGQEPYVFFNTVAPVLMEDQVVAKNIGIVEGLDPNKREYEAGETICFIRDPELTMKVTAPSHLTVKGEQLVINGMNVGKGSVLFNYYDNQRMRLNLSVPPNVNSFTKVKMTVDGNLVGNVTDVLWDLNPQQKDAHVSLIANVASPIPLGKEVVLKASFFPPEDSDKKLNSIVGESQTITQVGESTQYVLRSPADGMVQFLVYEGQKVTSGQVVALVGFKDPDGNYLVEPFAVRAPSNGYVTKLSKYESNSFLRNDELLRIGTGTVLVGGDVNQSNRLLLLPKDLKISIGDPVVIETPTGLRLAGKISVINPLPHSSTVELGGYQAVQVMAFDQHNILQSNLPVRVILPNDDQKIYLATVLAENSSRSAVGVGPLPSQVLDKSGAISSGQTSANNFALQADIQAINLSDVERLVSRNRIGIGTEAIKVLEKKEAERFPKASRFSLTGGVWMTGEGKLAFSGGLKGTINNMVSGGVQSGNAIGAAVPIVYQLAGNIIDVVSGKVNKQEALAIQMTQIAVHHMETQVYHQVKESQ